MRSPARPLTSVAALALVLAAGPATRPSVDGYRLRFCRYDGKAVVTTADLSVNLDRPFYNQTRIGTDTLTISGTVERTGRHHDVRLHVTYEEVDADPRAARYRKVSTTLETDPGQEQTLAGGPGNTRVAVTVTPVDGP